MSIYLDTNKLKQKLVEKGLSLKDIPKILSAINELPLIMEPNTGKISAGDHFEIELLNVKNKEATPTDILKTYMWKSKIPGIENNRIMSIEIPKLDSESNIDFKLKLEIYPFDLPIIFPIEGEE